MWRRYYAIIWLITANVKKISPSIMAEYCYPWKFGEDITQYCVQLLLFLVMWRRYHAVLWPITANVKKIAPNIMADYCYPLKC